MGKSGHIWEIPKKKNLQDLLTSCSLREMSTDEGQRIIKDVSLVPRLQEPNGNQKMATKGRVIYGKNGICNRYQWGAATVFPLDGVGGGYSLEKMFPCLSEDSKESLDIQREFQSWEWGLG